jgi:hypothetical protein
MEIIIILTAILQSMAVSLGVGSSTLAITNFFVAIADGRIDENERKMMGVVYIVLRIAMVLILLTTGVLTAVQYATHGAAFLSPFVLGFWAVVAVLYINAVMMTKHLMPSTMGPALQASSWYTLGVLIALSSLGLTGYSLFEFSLAYVTAILLAISVVNGIMAVLKSKKSNE